MPALSLWIRRGLLGAWCLCGPVVLASAAEKQDPAAISANLMRSADEDKDERLSEAETKRARTILRAVLLKPLPETAPGGEKTIQRIEKLAAEGRIDADKDGYVSLSELTGFLTDRFQERDEIIKDANVQYKKEIEAQRRRDAEKKLAEQKRLAEKKRQAEIRRRQEMKEDKAKAARKAEKKRDAEAKEKARAKEKEMAKKEEARRKDAKKKEKDN